MQTKSRQQLPGTHSRLDNPKQLINFDSFSFHIKVIGSFVENFTR